MVAEVGTSWFYGASNWDFIELKHNPAVVVKAVHRTLLSPTTEALLIFKKMVGVGVSMAL